MKLPAPEEFVECLMSGGNMLIGENYYKIDYISVPPAHELDEGFSMMKVLFKDGYIVILKMKVNQ